MAKSEDMPDIPKATDSICITYSRHLQDYDFLPGVLQHLDNFVYNNTTYYDRGNSCPNHLTRARRRPDTYPRFFLDIDI